MDRLSTCLEVDDDRGREKSVQVLELGVEKKRELANMLKAELPEYVIKIAEALESKNYSELKSQVHKLHGAARCCGTPALRQAAEHAEQAIDNKQYDVLTEAISKLSHEISRVLAFSIKMH